MHDIRLIRDDPEAFDAAMARRGLEAQAGAILTLDEGRRGQLTAVQEGQARRNELSKEFGELKRAGKEPTTDVIAELNSLKRNLPQGEVEAAKLEDEIQVLLARLPNRPADDVPEGADETGNVEQKTWGTKRQFNYAAANHADLGPALGLDFETGALIAGSRFTFLRGQMARLQRALGQFMLDVQTSDVDLKGKPKSPFLECAPPLLVRDEAMIGTGQLPKFANDSFSTRISASDDEILAFQRDMREALQQRDTSAASLISDSLLDRFQENPQYRRWLIPTSEVSLTNSIREQILDTAALPIRMTALTPCFRSEAGSAGKDTRGYIRQHQFEKVELVTICRPENSAAEHEKMTLAAEAILEALDLPYRRMLLCAGDMGFASRKTYDLEVWLPGQDAYREISSISNCGDFQARRMNARFRPAGEKGTQFVHTLNGSGLAVGRTLVAVLENYQQEDGSVHLPEVLHAYMGGVTRLTPNA